MAWLQPPITGDHKLDAWTLRLTQQINQGVIPGSGGASIGGGGGADSNTALYLYQRTLTDDAPNRPTSVVFNFRAESAVQSADEGWSGSIPPQVDGDYLWVTFRYVSATAGSINDVNSWDTPALLSTPTAAPGRDAIVVQYLSVQLMILLQIPLHGPSKMKEFSSVTTWETQNIY